MTLDVTPRPGASHRTRRVLAHARLELTMLARNGEQLLLTVVIPLGLLLLLAKTSVVDLGTSTPQERINVVVPGIFALAVLSTSFTALAIQTGFERRYGVLRRVATTPLTRGDVVAGKGAAVLLVEFVQILVLGAVGAALGWRPDVVGLVLVVPVVILGSASLASLALLLAGVVRAEATLAVANLGYLLLAAAGVLVPVAQLPDRLQPVVDLLPSAALAEALRDATISGQVNLTELTVLLAWLVVAGFAVTRTFRWE